MLTGVLAQMFSLGNWTPPGCAHLSLASFPSAFSLLRNHVLLIPLCVAYDAVHGPDVRAASVLQVLNEAHSLF